MADGEIVFSFEVDSKKAQAELDRVGRKMQNLADKAKTLESLKLPLEDDAKRLGAELDAAKAKLAEMQNAPAGQYSADQIAAQQETVASLQTQWDAVTKKIEQYNGQINAANASMQVQESRANELTQTVAGLKQQEEEAAAAAEKQSAAMERARQIAEGFKSAFSGIGSSIFQGVSSGIRSIPHLITKAFSGGVSAVRKFGAALAAATKKFNVFSRISDAFGSKLQRISRLASRVFVYSMITKAFRAIRSQASALLLTNDSLTAALARLKSALLTAFQPILDAVVPALTSLVNHLASAINSVTEFTAALFGTTASQAQENAKALYDQAEATEEAGAAASDASKSLASFDEINKLSSESSGSSTESTVTPQFDAAFDSTVYDTWAAAFSAFLDKIIKKLPDLNTALESSAAKMNTFTENLLDMFSFDGVEGKIKTLASGVANALDNMIAKINWNQLGAAFGAGMNTIIWFAVEFVDSFDWLQLGSSIAGAINGAVSQIDWYALGRLLFSGVKIGLQTMAGLIMGLDMVELAQAASSIATGFFDSISDTIAAIDWKKIGNQIKTFLVNLDWAGIATAAAQAAGAVVGAAVSLVWDAIKSAWDNVVNWWHENAIEDGKFTIEGLFQGIEQAVANIGNWIKDHIFTPFINGFKRVFGISSPSKVMAEQGKYLMQGVKQGIMGSIQSVVTAFSSLWTTIKDWWAATVAPVFTIDFWKAKFSAIGDALVQKIKDAINAAISLFNTFIDWINDKMEFSWDSLSIAGQEIIPAGSFQLLSIPNIPYLASGAVIPPNREFLAVLGDQKSGTNVEAPLATIKQAVAEVLASMGGGNNEQTAYLVLDELVLGKVIYRLNKAESNRIGVNLAEV